jgi:alkylhydroperoxidase/carboxymuconolactone decarboxylase family protein YurZ
MFPTMSKDMMEMWFGKTFNREGLDAKTRLLVTFDALTVLGAEAEPQLKTAVRHALEAGATQREIAEVQAAMIIAKRFPRDPVAAMDRIMNACTRPTLAEVAAYLVEMETHVNLIFQGGLDAIRSTSGAIVKLRAAYDKIEAAVKARMAA